MKKAMSSFLVVLVLLTSVFEIQAQNMFRKVNDFDGGEKADIAVFRPSTSVWYLLQSAAGFTAL